MLGDNIRRERRSRNIKQECVAQKLGIKQGTYSRIENNKIKPTFERVERIAEALSCPICAFSNTGEGGCPH
jgi:transcriptional regulator with XRE-family HTH domain